MRFTISVSVYPDGTVLYLLFTYETRISPIPWCNWIVYQVGRHHYFLIIHCFPATLTILNNITILHVEVYDCVWRCYCYYCSHYTLRFYCFLFLVWTLFSGSRLVIILMHSISSFFLHIMNGCVESIVPVSCNLSSRVLFPSICFN